MRIIHGRTCLGRRYSKLTVYNGAGIVHAIALVDLPRGIVFVDFCFVLLGGNGPFVFIGTNQEIPPR